MICRSSVEIGERSVSLQERVFEVRTASPNPGGQAYATAVLWHPRVQPVEIVWPGAGAFQRRVAAVVLDVAGRRVAVASYHADPARKYQRVDDAASLVMCMTRGAFDDAVLCGDFNDTGVADPDWTVQAFRPDFVYEAEWDCPSETGTARLRPDRRPAQTLQLGGLSDTAGLIHAPAAATCGHWPGDWSHSRRKDRIYVTQRLKQAVQSVEVVRSDRALRASDHLPVVLCCQSQVAQR